MRKMLDHWYRDQSKGLLGGVSAGIAGRFNAPVFLVRLAWIVLLLIGGVGLAGYLILWLLLPEKHTGRRIISINQKHHG